MASDNIPELWLIAAAMNLVTAIAIFARSATTTTLREVEEVMLVYFPVEFDLLFSKEHCKRYT